MTLFWHDHFAVQGQDTPLMLSQNDMMRRLALGNFRDAAARGHPRPGHAALPVARRLEQGAAQRELRARADGALHARHRLHGARHPRGRARAHRLPRAARLRDQPARRHLHARAATTPGSRRSSASAGASTGRTCSSSRVTHPDARAVPRREAVELLRHDRRSTARRVNVLVRALHAARATRSSRSSRRSWPARRALPRSSRRRTWSSAPVVFIAGFLRSTGRPVDPTTGRWLLRRHGPEALLAAVGRGLGLGPGVAVDERHARALPRSRTTCSDPPGRA